MLSAHCDNDDVWECTCFCALLVSACKNHFLLDLIKYEYTQRREAVIGEKSGTMMIFFYFSLYVNDLEKHEPITSIQDEEIIWVWMGFMAPQVL